MAAALASLALPLEQELVVDLFAGGGGASTGIAAAYREPDVAVNHSVAAIAAHEVNHPSTLHFRCDVWEVDPVAATGGRPVGLLWASPDCRHFSKAKGGKPVSDQVRSLADVVVKWARATRPRVIALENVEEFTTWGPLLPDGKPCPLQRGLTFRRWVRDLETEGYVVEHRELRACDYGSPTLRKRLFVIARRDGQPIVWPAPTHGKPSDPRVLSGELRPYRTAADCIDWTIPVCSIFATPTEARAWAADHGQKPPQRPLKANTLRRVAKGIVRYVIESPRPFIVPLRGTSPAHTSTHGVDEPAATVSARGQHHALCVPHLTECANGSTQRVFPGDEPLRTQCAQVKGGHFAVATPLLIEAAHGEESANGAKRWGHGARAADEPVGTVHAGGGNFAIAAPTLLHVNHQGERAGALADEPLPTITAGGQMARPAGAAHALGVVSACFEQANGCHESPGHDARKPMSTITGTGSQQRLVTAHLIQYYSTGGDTAPANEAARTITTKGRVAVVESIQIRADVLSDQQWHTARQAAALLREYFPERFPAAGGEAPEIVMIGDYILVDIGLRMLKPRELARAQGLPDSYVLDPVISIESRGRIMRRRLTATEQVKLIGNSVCPQVAEALVTANLASLLRVYRSSSEAA